MTEWCVPKATIHSFDEPVWGGWVHEFHPKFTLVDGECDVYKNFWLLPDFVTDKGFIIDFGCIAVFDKVILRNTADWIYDRR